MTVLWEFLKEKHPKQVSCLWDCVPGQIQPSLRD
jgi:hypothetical protein